MHPKTIVALTIILLTQKFNRNMTTIEKLKDLRSKFESPYMAVNIMDSLISYEYFNDDSFCKIVFNSEAINGRKNLLVC